MGMSVVGLVILGLCFLFILYYHQLENIHEILVVLTSFSFGGSSIAFFARVGGGIYTKAADVGADLVGKVEAGIPDRKSTRLNSSHVAISYAVFCLKKKKKNN